jgi:hypothetical protein
MAFSGGTFSLIAGNPVTTNTTISSTWANNTLNDIATNGLSLCVLKDGSQTITANIPMASFKLTGLGAGTAATDAANLSQAQAQHGSTLTSVAGTNTITGTATPTPAYTVGQKWTFIPAVTNTGATTLNISSLGAGAVQWNGAALTGGELVAGTAVTVVTTAATPTFEIIGAWQFPDTRALVIGGTDPTKKVRFEVDGITTGTTRVLTVPNNDLTIGGVIGAAQATTSGSSIDITGIPTWVKRITVTLAGVSGNGTANFLFQLGISSGLVTSGYLCGASSFPNAGAIVTINTTTGFAIAGGIVAAGVYHGIAEFVLIDAGTNTWAYTCLNGRSDGAATNHAAGRMILAGTLDRLSLVTTDTFDAGLLGYQYE